MGLIMKKVEVRIAIATFEKLVHLLTVGKIYLASGKTPTSTNYWLPVPWMVAILFHLVDHKIRYNQRSPTRTFGPDSWINLNISLNKTVFFLPRISAIVNLYIGKQTTASKLIVESIKEIDNFNRLKKTNTKQKFSIMSSNPYIGQITIFSGNFEPVG